MSRVPDTVARKIRTRGRAEAVGSQMLLMGVWKIGLGVLLCLAVLFVGRYAILSRGQGVEGLLRGYMFLFFGVGLPLLLVGVVIVLVDLGWMFWFMKRPTEEVSCPHCQKRNEVLAGESRFACDECQQVIERHGNRGAGDAPPSV
jgi:hypothetical protein